MVFDFPESNCNMYKFLKNNPEDNCEEIHMTNLIRKSEYLDGIMDLNISPIDLQDYKVQLALELQNNPIVIPYENEDAKALKTIAKVAEQDVSIEQTDEWCMKSSNLQALEYVVNTSILVKSLHGMVLLSKPYSPRLCMSDSDEPMKTNQPNQWQNEEEGSKEEGESSQEEMTGDDDSNDDEEEDEGSERLLVSPEEIKDELLTEFHQLNHKEQNYLNHFEHAHECPKTRGAVCSLQQCTNPREVINFCASILTSEPAPNEIEAYLMFSKILIYHALHCTKRIASEQCPLPLCDNFNNVVLGLHTYSPNREPKPYDVVYSTKHFIRGSMREGLDFNLLYAKPLGKGQFGEVLDACYVDRHGIRAHVAVKVNTIFEETRMKECISCLNKLSSFEHLLLPEVILKSLKQYLFIMDSADTSLWKYLKKKDTSGKDIYNRDNPIPLCKFYFHQMAKGVNYCHAMGLVHGDIKPSNTVLLDYYRVLKIIDWDFLKEENRVEFRATGSRGYAAPEVERGNTVLKESDVYSLCRSLLPLLYGKESVLHDQNVHNQLNIHCPNIAGIYELGTREEPKTRISSQDILEKMTSMQPLDFQPPIPEMEEMNKYDQCLHLIRKRMIWRLEPFSMVRVNDDYCDYDMEA